MPNSNDGFFVRARFHFDKIFAVDSETRNGGREREWLGEGGKKEIVVTLLETRPRNSIALFLVYENETTSPRISRATHFEQFSCTPVNSWLAPG